MTATPLIVDLDGTLIYTDMQQESALRVACHNPLNLFRFPYWLSRGKAYLKQQLATRCTIDPTLLPYNEPLIDWLKEQRAAGRPLILCTATDQVIANTIAVHLGIFDAVMASDGMLNLASHHKARALTQRFGHQGFDYVGNSRDDLNVWRCARRAIVVNASHALLKKAATCCPIERVFSKTGSRLQRGCQVLRVQQWLKNVLLFIPNTIDLTLVGRDLLKTQRVADDLHVRSPQSTIRVLNTDFLNPLAIGQLVDDIMAIGPIDVVLIAHGTLANQADLQTDLNACADTLMINGVSPVLFAEAFAGGFKRANFGTLALIGSVAGDRGRKSNYSYGVAKGLVERFMQGLQHRFANTPIKIVLIKPGPTATPMTAHLLRFPMANVEDVAAIIVKGMAAGKPVIYAPAKWALIMLVIRHLPRCIFNKINI